MKKDKPKIRITSRLKKKVGEDTAMACKQVLDAIIELLEDDNKSIQAKLRSEPKDVPNYTHQQAFLAGEAKRISSLIGLITIKGE